MLVLIAVGIGIVFSAIFHLGVRENRTLIPLQDREAEVGESTTLLSTIEKSTLKRLNMTWKCWLKEPQFFQVLHFKIIE